MTQSIYSGLTPTKPGARDTFSGEWHGRQVEFDRTFRGYRFSDQECVALLAGEMLEVHGIGRNEVKYSVMGALRETRFGVRFQQESTISFNPDYKFEDRRVMLADGTVVAEARPRVKPVVSMVAGSGAEADEAYINNFDPSKLDEGAQEMEAQLEAMLEVPVLPPVTKVSGPDEPPRFVVTFALLPESVQEAAAARTALLPDRYDPYYDGGERKPILAEA